jgi:hypothetical protein
MIPARRTTRSVGADWHVAEGDVVNKNRMKIASSAMPIHLRSDTASIITSCRSRAPAASRGGRLAAAARPPAAAPGEGRSATASDAEFSAVQDLGPPRRQELCGRGRHPK